MDLANGLNCSQAPLSPEDEEALRLMKEEACPAADRRSEGDEFWFANGTRIELHGLQAAKTLNGQLADVIGFDDAVMRYRVRLVEDSTVKVVAKKNMRPAPPDPFPKVFVPATPEAGDRSINLGPLPVDLHAASNTSLDVPVQTASVQLVPPRAAVCRAYDKVHRDLSALHQSCVVRQRLGAADETDLSDKFVRLNASYDTFLEVFDMYQKAYPADEALQAQKALAVDGFDEVVDTYQPLRTWSEWSKDEWHLAHHSIKKHGLVGTLKNEFVEVGLDLRDAAQDVAQDASGIMRSGSEAATHMPRLLRSATGSVSTAAQRGSLVATQAAGRAMQPLRIRASNLVEDQVVTPIKRTWHLLLTAFLLCFIVPLFALRAYAPLNSVFANLGLVYAILVIICPPSCAQSRGARGGLLLLWPIVVVVLPVALNYWVMHPPQLSWPQLQNSESSPRSFVPGPTMVRQLRHVGKVRPARNEGFLGFLGPVGRSNLRSRARVAGVRSQGAATRRPREVALFPGGIRGAEVTKEL
mmetsp:Transcript_64043/g.139270  ORF Transcript_64043/g.139270 Transcript_64043/m.139270 type:complete len:526 (-) Transcript_64043:90-1667(-)|eukprot:CAMPEP_0170609944 /NCGR_PEP_ID=MMETSP0224-20130122/22390_1 /TAXON_ID=285029 /ORGANISM="Togula jolla, Strain CCCM 725" /LENGTH=525 /DNA_ID=CAMNT_0010935275 /DNA_START=54 /DNA_END=1631 /DNA_ORIENTATION=+